MILDCLYLRNFKRFREAEVEFRDGITGILGNNGTGKSSLVSAILFALYGVKATGVSADYIVSSFAGPKEKCEVVLDFRIGGDDYKIIRTFRKGKTVTHDAEFYKNKKLLAKEVTPVEEAVRREIGMGPVDFRNTIYAAQKDLLTLLENTPGKRKEWFQKALGIDYLKNGSDLVLKAEIDEKTAELQKMTGRLDALAGRLDESELSDLQKTVAALTADIGRFAKRKADLTAQRAETDAVLRVLAERKSAHDRLVQQQLAAQNELLADEARKKKTESDLATLEKDEAEYHRLEKVAARYGEIRARLDALAKKRAEYQQLTGELGFSRNQIAELESRIGGERLKIAGIEEEGKEYARLTALVRNGIGAGPDVPDDRFETAVNYRIADLMKQSGSLTARQEQYREEAEKLNSDRRTIAEAGPDGICPLCRQKLGAHYGDLEREFAGKLRELEDRAVRDLTRLEKLEADRKAAENLRTACGQIRTLAAHLKRKAEYEGTVSELTRQLEAKQEEQKAREGAVAHLGYDEKAFTAAAQAEAEARNMQARFTDLGKKVGQLTGLKQQLAALTGRVAERKGALAVLAEQLAGMLWDPSDAEAAGNRLQETDAALRDADVAIAGADRDRKFAQEKIAQYRKAEEQVAFLQKEVKELSEEIELTKLTRSLIAEYVVYLMQVVRSRLEGEVSRIISEITGGRYEQVLLDGDFNLLVRDVDDDYPVDRFSGGEQDDIAVALRIALSRYLAELHSVHESTVLIFDEIFGSQDEERRNSLLFALRTQESRFPQILLISHIAEMQGEFANTLVVETGSDNTSRVREVT